MAYLEKIKTCSSATKVSNFCIFGLYYAMFDFYKPLFEMLIEFHKTSVNDFWLAVIMK